MAATKEIKISMEFKLNSGFWLTSSMELKGKCNTLKLVMLLIGSTTNHTTSHRCWLIVEFLLPFVADNIQCNLDHLSTEWISRICPLTVNQHIERHPTQIFHDSESKCTVMRYSIQCPKFFQIK